MNKDDGSVLTFVTVMQDGTFYGTYRTKGNSVYPAVGRYYTLAMSSVGWVVTGIKDSGDSDTVTSWAGQFQHYDTIKVAWIESSSGAHKSGNSVFTYDPNYKPPQ